MDIPPLHVDLTDWIVIGEQNKISVTVRNDDPPNSRWYSGSGIYRPVHLAGGVSCSCGALGGLCDHSGGGTRGHPP